MAGRNEESAHGPTECFPNCSRDLNRKEWLSVGLPNASDLWTAGAVTLSSLTNERETSGPDGAGLVLAMRRRGCQR